MFNLSEEMVLKQCRAGGLYCDNNQPINADETFEPCIRGAIKILQNPELKELVKEALNRS